MYVCKVISQLIKQAFPEIHEEVDEVRFGSFKRVPMGIAVN